MSKKMKFKTSKKTVSTKGFNAISSEEAMDLQEQFAEMFKREAAGEDVDFNDVQEESERAAEAGFNSVMADVLSAVNGGNDSNPSDENTVPEPEKEQEDAIDGHSKPAFFDRDKFMENVVFPPQESNGVYDQRISEMLRRFDSFEKNLNLLGVSLKQLIDANNVIEKNIRTGAGVVVEMNKGISDICESIYDARLKNICTVGYQKTSEPTGSTELPFSGMYQNENGWWNPRSMVLSVSDGTKSACSLDLGGDDIDAILYRYAFGTSRNVSEWSKDTQKDDIVDYSTLLDLMTYECISAMSPYAVMTASEFIEKFGAIGKWHPSMTIRYIKLTTGKWNLEEGAYIMIYLIDKYAMHDDLSNMLARAVLLGKPYTISKILVDYLEEYGFHFQPYDIKKFIDSADRQDKINKIISRLEKYGKDLKDLDMSKRETNPTDYADAFVSAMVRSGVMIPEATLNKAYDRLDDLFDHIADDDDESAGNIGETGDLLDPESDESPEDVDFESEEEEDFDEEDDAEDLDEDYEEEEDVESETVYSDPDSENVPTAFANLQNLPVEDVSEEPEIEDVEDVDLANASLPDATTETPKEQRYIYRPQQ